MKPMSDASSSPMEAPPQVAREISVVVADRSRARLFHILENSDELLELDDLVNSDARMAENELVSDRQGRGLYGGLFGRRGRRTTFGKSGSKRPISAENFASTIYDLINGHMKSRNNSVTQIVVIASPEFMGALLPYLRKLASRVPVREIMKNITRQDIATIRGYLPERLWPRRVSGITLE